MTRHDRRDSLSRTISRTNDGNRSAADGAGGAGSVDVLAASAAVAD